MGAMDVVFVVLFSVVFVVLFSYLPMKYALHLHLATLRKARNKMKITFTASIESEWEPGKGPEFKECIVSGELTSDNNGDSYRLVIRDYGLVCPKEIEAI